MAFAGDLLKDTTSKILEVRLRNITTGQGLTGLAHSSVSCYYVREGAASAVQVVLASGTLGVWSSGGWQEVDSAHMPGIYQFGIPNAALATGANGVTFHFGSAAALDKDMRFNLVDLPVLHSDYDGAKWLKNMIQGTPPNNQFTPFALAANPIVGAGSVSKEWPAAGDPFRRLDTGDPIEGVALWITSDIAGTDVIAGTQYTNMAGYAPLNWMLDPGTVYGWAQKGHWTFASPYTIVVT